MNKPKYIRNNMEIPDWILAQGLNESLYYVKVCKEVKRNDYYEKNNTGRTKFNKLTDDMRTYLVELDDNLTQKEMTTKFNRAFGFHELTPMSRTTIPKYRDRLMENYDPSKNYNTR